MSNFYSQVKNPVWADAAQTIIDCEIEHSTYGWIPFTASPNDVENHGRAIFAELCVGVVGAYVPPPILVPTNAQQEVARKDAYEQEADPIFFKAQRGEATVAEWEAKIAEIKARYPYFEEQLA